MPLSSAERGKQSWERMSDLIRVLNSARLHRGGKGKRGRRVLFIVLQPGRVVCVSPRSLSEYREGALVDKVSLTRLAFFLQGTGAGPSSA